MKDNIIYKFAKKGINLSPEAYEKLLKTEDPISASSTLIVKLKGNKHKKDDLVSVSGELADKYLNLNKTEKKEEKTTPETPKPPIQTPKKPIPPKTTKETPTKDKPTPPPKTEKTKEEQKKEAYIQNNSTKNLMEIEEKEVSSEFKRNLTKTNVNFDNFEILTDTTGKSYTSGEVNNIIEYFNSRYNKISKIIKKHPEMKAQQKISDIKKDKLT